MHRRPVPADLQPVRGCVLADLPASLTRYDISASKLYSITSNTKAVVNALEKDVTIYWVVQSGQEDPVIEHLLSKYGSLSGRIQVVRKNPDVYPTFAEQYTDEPVRNNSLIVECGNRSRYIGYDDIYLQDVDLSSYYNVSYSFDGEGAITSAIDYVVSEEFPQLYLLEGHGEAGLPAYLQAQIEKENIETHSLSLLTVDAVPEEADCIMIYAPSSDISQEERDMLAGYSMTGYEREEGDLDGPFTLAVSVETGGGGQIVWFTSSRFLEELYNAASSGANSNLGMNALSSLIGETEAMTIRSKSLNYSYLTISGSTASLLKILMIGIFPLAYLGVGVWVVLKRRGAQNEPV